MDHDGAHKSFVQKFPCVELTSENKVSPQDPVVKMVQPVCTFRVHKCLVSFYISTLDAHLLVCSRVFYYNLFFL